MAETTSSGVPEEAAGGKQDEAGKNDEVEDPNDFLMPITVKELSSGKEETLLCAQDATAEDIKTVICQDYWKELVAPHFRDGLAISCNVQLMLYDPQGTPLFGALQKTNPHQQSESSSNMTMIAAMPTSLLLRVTAIDPPLQSLLEFTGMGEVTERERMMKRMMAVRAPQNCPGNHSLPLDQAECGSGVMMCAKCVWYAFRGRGCESCNFALCNKCLATDQGMNYETISDSTTKNTISTASNDPYFEKAVGIASRIGQKFATVMDSNGFNLHSTSIRWNSEFGGEIRPSIFPDDPKWHGIKVHDKAQILHRGIRLVVRLGPKLRAIVSNVSKPSMHPGETDQILPKGATLLELKRYGRKLLEDKESWSKVTAILKYRVHGKFVDFEDVPNAYKLSMKLVSFQPTEVIYEVHAEVSSMFLAGKRSFRGECGYNFGMRADGIKHRILAAGAYL